MIEEWRLNDSGTYDAVEYVLTSKDYSEVYTMVHRLKELASWDYISGPSIDEYRWQRVKTIAENMERVLDVVDRQVEVEG